MLAEVLADYKKQFKDIDYSFLSDEDAVRAYRILEKQALKEEKKQEKAKEDIQTPLDTPPAQDTKPKTFLERQKAAGYDQNLFNAGGLLAKIDKLYK